MFRKLRWQLTFINVGVMALLILLSSSSIYYFMNREIYTQSGQLMQLIVDSAKSGNANIMVQEKYKSKYFYARTDAGGHVVETSAGVPVPPLQFAALTQEALLSKANTGKVEWNNESYQFLRVTSTGKIKGFIIAFVNVHSEEQILNSLLALLITVGLTGLALSFFGSLYMAEKALIPINESWQRQKDFTADASHELRSPISVIQTNLEVVMGNPLETVASQAKWLENIRAEAGRMAKLVSDLLFLARADSHQKILEMSRFPLQITMQEAFTSFEPRAKAGDIHLELQSESPVSFFGDETRLKQLVVILVDNAFKHTPPGGSIRLEMRDEGPSVELKVSDTGEGIPKEHLHKIFKRFYRVDKSRSRQEGGTGLGLAIAEWIVREHRGTIKVSSTPGQGTAFVITLPKLK